MRSEAHATAAYLASLSQEMAVMAERADLPVLAHLFHMAEMEANSINNTPETKDEAA